MRPVVDHEILLVENESPTLFQRAKMSRLAGEWPGCLIG
jgi:hypothetical protein